MNGNFVLTQDPQARPASRHLEDAPEREGRVKVGEAPFKKVTLTRPNALAFGENWKAKSLLPILAGIGEHALLRPHIGCGDEISNQAWAIFDEGRAFTCNAPAVQCVLGNLQMGGGIFDGQ
jgi:hypothetical protein